MNTEENVYFGVDVSKKYLDVYLGRKTVRFDNSLEGVVGLMKKSGEVHFVFESTGGYDHCISGISVTFCRCFLGFHPLP